MTKSMIDAKKKEQHGQVVRFDSGVKRKDPKKRLGSKHMGQPSKVLPSRRNVRILTRLS